MKKEIDPKVMGLVIAVVVVIAGAGLYLGLKGQGDRSGPLVQAKYEAGSRGPGGGGFVPGQPAGGSHPGAGGPGPGGGGGFTPGQAAGGGGGGGNR